VKPHVIRFWEKEFKSLKPRKSATGQRIFTRRDVERLSTIKHLLYTQRFTIEGARKYLREHGIEQQDAEPSAEQRAAERMKEGLCSVRAKLVSLLAQLDARKTGSAR
jgi:DNA-binding transcriptional MerR regulator